jgi:hypothetical protein
MLKLTAFYSSPFCLSIPLVSVFFWSTFCYLTFSFGRLLVYLLACNCRKAEWHGAVLTRNKMLAEEYSLKEIVLPKRLFKLLVLDAMATRCVVPTVPARFTA